MSRVINASFRILYLLFLLQFELYTSVAPGRLTVMVMDLYFLVYLSAPYQMHASGILDRVSGARMQGMGVCLT
jgi:hypothetical protein